MLPAITDAIAGIKSFIDHLHIKLVGVLNPHLSKARDAASDLLDIIDKRLTPRRAECMSELVSEIYDCLNNAMESTRKSELDEIENWRGGVTVIAYALDSIARRIAEGDKVIVRIERGLANAA